MEKERRKEASCADDAVGEDKLGGETVTTAIIGDVDVLLAGGAFERCDGEEAGQQRWGKAVSTAKGKEGVWTVVAEMGERWQHLNAKNEERGRR